MVLDFQSLFDLIKVLNFRKVFDLDINRNSCFRLNLPSIRINDGDIQRCQIEVIQVYKFIFGFFVCKHSIACTLIIRGSLGKRCDPQRRPLRNIRI